MFAFLVSSLVFSSGTSNLNTFSQNVRTDGVEKNGDFTIWITDSIRNPENYISYLAAILSVLGFDTQIEVVPLDRYLNCRNVDGLDPTLSRCSQPDLALVRFGDQGFDKSLTIVPSFSWQYSSESFIGQSLYNLDNPSWQAWQRIDTGIQQQNVDGLIDEIEFELNLSRKADLVDDFAELFMTQLLYDFPLVSTQFRRKMWTGFGGPNNELWNPNEGEYRSIARGAGWEDRSPTGRFGNSTTLRLPYETPQTITYDPMQALGTDAEDIIEPMSVNLLDFDFGFNSYPSIAYNWVNTDLVNYAVDGNDSQIQNIDLGNFTYYIRDDAFWSASVDINGNLISPHQVDAQDFWFTHEIYQLKNVVLSNQDAFTSILGTQVMTSLYPNDTLSVYVDDGTYRPLARKVSDYFTLGNINPMPYHILGGDLTFTNASGTWIGDIYTLDSLGINVQQTDEWLQWSNIEGSSLVGPYDIVDIVPNEIRTYQVRDDFFYPNEWDAGNQPTIENGIFAPHKNSINPNPINWAWADQGGQEKPVSPLIKSIVYMIIDDDSLARSAFEDGLVDTAEYDFIEQSDNGYAIPVWRVTKSVMPINGPNILVFNLANEHLKKLNVRKAIASMIDKDQLVRTHNGFATPHQTPVWSYQTAWYKPFPVQYSPSFARDLMRSEGYFWDNPTFCDCDPILPTQTTVVSVEGSTVTLTENIFTTTDVTKSTTKISLRLIPILLVFVGYGIKTRFHMARKSLGDG